MNESAVKPIVTMRPATPASDRRKPMRQARMLSVTQVSTAITASEAMMMKPSAR